MTRQVDGQDREAAIGEEGGQGPPSVQVSSLTVHEQGPTITLSRTQAAQRECAGPGKLDRQNANVIHACRLDPQRLPVRGLPRSGPGASAPRSPPAAGRNSAPAASRYG